MKRIYHPYTEWEEYSAGMWRKVSREEAEKLLPIAVEFTGDHVRYGAAMLRVTREWIKSCEHNLTDKSINRKAWIGHAACCLELGLPEYIVRAAWGKLSQLQRDLANKAAERAILHWTFFRFTNINQIEFEY